MSFLVHDTEDTVLGELGSQPWQGQEVVPRVRTQVLVASVQCRGTRRMEGDEQPLRRGQDMEAWTVPGPGIPEVAFSLLRTEPVAAQAPLCCREQLWLHVFPVCWCVRREMEGWPAECHSTQPGWSCPMYNSPERDSGLRQSCPRPGPDLWKGHSTSMKRGPTKDP